MSCEKCNHQIGYHAADPEGKCTAANCSCDGYWFEGRDLYADDKIPASVERPNG